MSRCGYPPPALCVIPHSHWCTSPHTAMQKMQLPLRHGGDRANFGPITYSANSQTGVNRRDVTRLTNVFKARSVYIPALCGLGLNPAAVRISNMLFELIKVEKNDILCCLAAFLTDQLRNVSE